MPGTYRELLLGGGDVMEGHESEPLKEDDINAIVSDEREKKCFRDVLVRDEPERILEEARFKVLVCGNGVFAREGR